MRLQPSISHPVLRKWHSNDLNLVYPLFLDAKIDTYKEVDPLLPEQKLVGLNYLVDYLLPMIQNGLEAVLLFAVIDPLMKTENEDAALCMDTNPVYSAIKILKKNFPDLLVICDVCLCNFTSHGKCGILKGKEICREMTLEALVKLSQAYVYAGADAIAPSDMNDGRIRSIREKITQPIISYSAKFNSCLYGGYRAACHIHPHIPRNTHQLPPCSRQIALRALLKDTEEGADFLIVKPAMTSLDVICAGKSELTLPPILAFQVSGEYSMIYNGARSGLFDLKTAVIESIDVIRRAGANTIITYFAPKLLAWSKEVNGGYINNFDVFNHIDGKKNE